MAGECGGENSLESPQAMTLPYRALSELHLFPSYAHDGTFFLARIPLRLERTDHGRSYGCVLD